MHERPRGRKSVGAGSLARGSSFVAARDEYKSVGGGARWFWPSFEGPKEGKTYDESGVK